MGSIAVNRGSRLAVSSRLWTWIGWWIFFLICALYGAFALAMGATEVAYRFGLVDSAPLRGLPLLFIVHALFGGLILLSAPLQFNRSLLRRLRLGHRVLGRVYVISVWASSAAGLWLAVFFDVSPAARLALGSVAVLWFGTTTIALRHIQRSNVSLHREWMIRSFALTLFFVTFSLWVPGMASTTLPEAIGYPLAIFLSWSLNLVVAEIWVRYTRKGAKR